MSRELDLQALRLLVHLEEEGSLGAAGRRLGITQSAVSQRAQAAGIVEGRRARELVTYLATQLIDPAGAAP